MSNLRKEHIFFLFILLYFFFISAFQATNNHWSSRIDQDIFLIYNSLLIYSGHDQGYIDHPAYTTLFILGGVYKILSFFLSNFTLDEVLNSNDIDQKLQNLFSVARILNSIYFFIYVYLVFKLLKELNIKIVFCYIATLLLLSFHSIYEVLFLIRSEVLSVIFSLLSFYFLVLFIKYQKSAKYCFFSGIFLSFAILTKIQIIFLIFIFILITPFLFSYYNCQNINGLIFKSKKFFILSSVLFSLGFAGYLIFEFFYAYSLLTKQFPMFHYFMSIPHYIDPIMYCLFFVFYFILLKYVSVKNNINFYNLINLFYIIIYGIIFSILFIFILDLIGLVKFNNKILFFLSNPIHKISMYTVGTFNTELLGEFSLGYLIESIKNIFYNNYKLFPNKNYTFELGGVLIGIVDFFRFFYILISAFIILFLIFSKNSKKELSIISILLFGIAILNLSFGARDGFGYNLYLYPPILLLLFLTFNKLNNRFVIYSALTILFTISFLEFYSLRNTYKLQFNRENRIYDICKIEKWKNSENYIKKFNENSFIPLTEDPRTVILVLYSKINLIQYCKQLEKKLGWKTNFFNIKIN